MEDLFSNMYIIAAAVVVIQYLISGKGNGVAGWVLPVISLAVVTYLQLFVWLPKSHGSDLPIILPLGQLLVDECLYVGFGAYLLRSRSI